MNIKELRTQDLRLSLWQVKDYANSLLNQTLRMQNGEGTIEEIQKFLEWFEGSEIDKLHDVLLDLGLELHTLGTDTNKREKDIRALNVPEPNQGYIGSDCPDGAMGYDR